MLAISAVAAIIGFVVYGGPTLGLPALTSLQLVRVLPGVFLFFMGIGVLFTTGISVFALPGFSAVGIGLAMLLGTIQQYAIYPIVHIGGPTLEQTQWIIIILCALIGGIVAAASRGN